MAKSSNIKISYKDLIRACQFYAQKEERDCVYPEALNGTQTKFGDPKSMTKAISSLLSIWHLVFYRFGNFSQEKLEECITDNLPALKNYQYLNLREFNLTESESDNIRLLFDSFLDATAGKNSKFTRRSPTAVSKTLNLIAPCLFPLWDEAISLAYDCWWVYSDFGANDYINFMQISKSQIFEILDEYMRVNSIADLKTAEQRLISECLAISGNRYSKSLLKIIDEYNYAKYTKNWL